MSQDIKERPILFSGAMVRTLLDGSKTQTRRVMARQKKHDFTDYTLFGQRGHPADEAECRGGWAQPWVAIENAPDWPDGEDDQCICPYASRRGDRLWVRETFAIDDNGHEEWPIYRADGVTLPVFPATRKPARWIPSIHMSRKYSRITLEITGVRVERLQDISEADAQDEGVSAEKYRGLDHAYARAFSELWESINGPGSWETNPWVWIVEFRRIEQ